MAFRPLGDRVLVKRVEEEEKTKGGIIIPDTAKEKPIEGEVVAVGNGKVLEDGTVKIGQTLDLYKLEIGRYPTTSEGLQALVTAPSGAPILLGNPVGNTPIAPGTRPNIIFVLTDDLARELSGDADDS